MVLACHVISQDDVIKGSCDCMVSHHPAKFDGHRHCGSGDIIFLVAEEENSRYSLFNQPLLYSSNGHGLKAHGISYY